jgi:FkbM family methyltransferase
MSNHQIGLKPNLVISVAELGCLESWKLTGPQLVSLVPAAEYWLIVPDNQLHQFVDNTPVEFTIFPESVFTQDFAEEFSRREGAALPERRGWYLQQLIKLAALKRASKLDRILIWDADTIPLREISFFDSQGNCRYFFGAEYHLPYFENIDRLLGLDKAHLGSFIAQNFPITGNQIESFFSYLGQRHSTTWWNAVLDSINFDEWSGFSEYETLGTFVSHLEDKPLAAQSGTWSRSGIQARVSKQITSGKKPRPDYDFVAVERWAQDIWAREFPRRVLRGLSVYLGKAFSFVSSAIKFPAHNNQIENQLAKIFDLRDGIDVIQIGANDGIQSDPLRKFLQNPGNFSARLIEPVPYYCEQFNKLYKDRPDVEIINRAAGSNESMMEFFHISPAIATEMNGTGPQDNWALKVGSGSRATVVHWIYKNSWRGVDYVEHIPKWIGAIEKLQVRVLRTQDLIRKDAKTLMIINVQGMESEVLLGLSRDNLPRWVVIDENLGQYAARKLLVGWGYTEVYTGSNSLFHLNQVN